MDVPDFFDASVVRYPSSYSYTGTYATRSLTPVAGYGHGTSMFTGIDVSSTIYAWEYYRGGVLGPNGLIYFVPCNADDIGIFDPSSSSFTTLDISFAISSDWKYNGGVLGPNGLIYFVPSNADNIGILDPSSTSFTTLDISISSDAKYSAGVLGPDGLIYFVPLDVDNIGILDPSSSSFTTLDISGTISRCAKYSGGVLGPNGLIYFVPNNVDNIGILDPSSRSFTTAHIPTPDAVHGVASFTDECWGGYAQYIGGVLGPNGLIYFVPFNSFHVGILDPSSSSFSTLDISSMISVGRINHDGAYKYIGGVLGPNGLIYFVPSSADNIGILDPSTTSFTTHDISSTISRDWKYHGGVLGPNGLIYFVPYRAPNIGNLNLGNTQPSYEVDGGVPEAWSSLLSPHFNKL